MSKSVTDWLPTILGHQFDGDNDNSFDCVDVPESWCNYLWPDKGWQASFGYGNAKDHYANASSDYFQKIPYSAGLVAQPGDVIVYGATANNPYGHIAVVLTANASSVQVVQENSFTQQAAYLGTLGYSNCIGLLRPKGEDFMTKEQAVDLARRIGLIAHMSEAEITPDWLEYQSNHILADPAYAAALAKQLYDGKTWQDYNYKGVHYDADLKAAGAQGGGTVLKTGKYIVQ